ncbi:S-protein homolog 2-like [Cornus florida]|uniref:S-protein homolog 2-like n=1 Tax=Cornus florida TaxID=4283 RepID=UPI00289EB46A|nr:S-protein homolog 2-like [Cornus florida]
MSLFSKCAILLLALSIILCNGVVVFSTTPDMKFGWPKITVRVRNNLGDGIHLNLHCKSKDDDLGNQFLSDGSSFQWRFRKNLIGTTLFFCSMSWNNVSGSFDIYVSQRDKGLCKLCVWSVRKDGLYEYNGEGGPPIAIYDWPKPTK